MPPPDNLVAFLIAALLLALAPGPDNCFVLTCATVYGRLAGLAVTGGLCTGLLVHSVAVALGLAGLVQAAPMALASIQLLGAGYLLWLAWQAFRSSRSGPTETAPPQPGLRRFYLRGIVMNLSNPKVAIFFLAFLPGFADPQGAPMAPQLLILGGLFVVATLLVFGGIALLAAGLGDAIGRSPAAQRWLQRMAALVFLLLAGHLLWG